MFIIQDIKFPVMLDMFDMCAPDLQEKLKPMRTKFKGILFFVDITFGRIM